MQSHIEYHRQLWAKYLYTHDNIIDSEDVITVLIEVHVSTSDIEPTNQVTACMRSKMCRGYNQGSCVECHLQGGNTGGYFSRGYYTI